jgi:hypothetical protein
MGERDKQFAGPPKAVDAFIVRWRQATEIEPTLAACAPYTGKIVAESGCGAGRSRRCSPDRPAPCWRSISRTNASCN